MGALRCACTLVLIVVALGVPETSLRGVDPQLIQRYQAPGTDFVCLDGLHKIPRKYVNDEYCDCFDGSDEPGTSACPNGSFYCRNRGHHPLRLNASMVDDLLCDCCDGSDERPGLCPVTCLEAGAAARTELKQRAILAAEGEQLREAYVQAWGQRQAQWSAEAKQLEVEITLKQKQLNYWQGKKAAVEAEEKLEQEKAEAVRLVTEAKAAAAATASNLVADSPAIEPPADEASQPDQTGTKVNGEGHAQPDADTAGATPVGEADSSAPAHIAAAGQEARPRQLGEEPAPMPSEIITSVEAEGASAEVAQSEAPAAEGNGELDDESAEERGKRIAAQWTHDPEAVGEVAEEQDAEANSQAYESQLLEAAEETLEPSPVRPGVLGTMRAWAARAMGFAKGAGVQLEQRQQVKDAHAKHQSALTELTGKLAELQRKLGQDFGPSGVFAALLDRCFTADVEKYTYEVCMYKEARQKEGASSTSLGTWTGFEDAYSTLVFDGGQHCWNGPQRSMRVSLKCGVDEQLANVSEPNRCEYVARLVTPAACTPELVALARSELAEAERELAAVHDEL